MLGGSAPVGAIRQDHRETAAVPLFAFDPQPPAMAVDDVLDDGEAEPGAGLAGIQPGAAFEQLGGPVVGRALGRVVGGRIEVTVASRRRGSLVTWRQTVRLPWLPARLRSVESLAARVVAPGYRQAIRTLLA
mgnify:CR=1 FL=1